MTWIILSILGAILIPVIGIIIGVIAGAAYDSENGKTGHGGVSGLVGGIIGSLIFLIIWAPITLSIAWSPVGAGHVGLVKGISGTYISQLPEGTHWVAPWKSVEVVSVQNQTFVAPGDCSDGEKNCLDAFTKDNNDAFVVGSLNWHVDPENVLTLYAKYPDFEKKIIESRFSQAVKDETVKYTADQIAPNREAIRSSVRDRLKADLSQYSISADDFLMPNIEFRAELKNSFEQKAQAAVDAQTEFNKVQISIQQAEQKKQAAIGDANALRETAKGQADANGLISQSITPTLVQWQMVQKLSDKISVMLLPAGGGSLLDISKLLPQQGQ